MSDAVIIAAIAAVPPTLVAYASFRQARAGKVQATGANKAVNDTKAGHGTLKETLTAIDHATRALQDDAQVITTDIAELHHGQARISTELGDLNSKVDRHLAVHQQLHEEALERAAREAP
jgi:uncharacterized phage infection (PIP) family protein YhgE